MHMKTIAPDLRANQHVRPSAGKLLRAPLCALAVLWSVLDLPAIAHANQESPDVPAVAASVKPVDPTLPDLARLDPTRHDPTLDDFLDRLMQAESAGIDTAQNPRSTALGPFQFIESTFLEIVEREFKSQTAGRDRDALLQLRTNRQFARNVARVYVRDSAEMLMENGEAATLANLRLAYLLGSKAALQILQAEDSQAVAPILGKAVVKANPFLASMTAKRLVAWSAKSIGEAPASPIAPAEAGVGAGKPPASVETGPPSADRSAGTQRERAAAVPARRAVKTRAAARAGGSKPKAAIAGSKVRQAAATAAKGAKHRQAAAPSRKRGEERS
jgi:hypothetical protein